MNSAAVYCRVSTDSQEREGTSLKTQLEHCLTYCRDKGYDATYQFSETYSGLSLERPELDKIRELVDFQAVLEATKELAQTPRPRGVEKVKSTGLWRIRQGDYRIIYGIDDKQRLITVVRIGHRREIYRSL
jgi:mRNA interferase RelE/StbE